MNETLESTRLFWNASPCGGLASLSARQEVRYRKEPFLPPLLARIAATHGQVVEVGCGQGTDGLTLCGLLPEQGEYLGLDYSETSLESARNAAREAHQAGALRVTPRFQHANAEQLPFPDNSVECILSVGVLHHTPGESEACAEIARVLQPGGKAYVLLYNCWAPKVAVAKLLRGVQWLVDRLSGRQKTLYRLLFGRHLEHWVGTMILECFGVPILNCHGARGMRNLFEGLNILALYTVGGSLLPGFAPATGPFGVYWFIELEKPMLDHPTHAGVTP